MERGPALLCTEGPLSGQQFSITQEGLRIGREPGNEIHLDDAGVSRQHARVLLHNGAVWVQDAGSRNGIFVNDVRVPDHKQLKVGDKLLVGTHLFEVVPAAAAAARPAAPAPAAEPLLVAKPAQAAQKAQPRWKIWPFMVAALLALGFIACLGVYGAIRGDGGAASAPTTSQPTYSLSTMLEPTGGGAPPSGAGATAAPTVTDALAVVAGADPAAALASVPDPPPGSTARQLLDLAQLNYDSGRLADARTQYQQALKLDPSCEICVVRVERIQGELAAKVQQTFDAGMRAYDARQYSQAISAWETVLMLVPEPTDPIHVRAKESLARAREGAAGR